VKNTSFEPSKSSDCIEKYLHSIEEKAALLCTNHPKNKCSNAYNHSEQRELLQSINKIKARNDVKVCLADKNLGFTLVNKEWYHTKAIEHLSNSITYKPIDDSYNLNSLWIEQYKLLSRHRVLYVKDNDKLRVPLTLSPLAKYILQLEKIRPAKAGKFYLTIKMHKNPPSTRPIVNTCGTPTYFASKHLNNLLTPVMRGCASYLKNSRELIKKLDTLTLPSSPIYLLTADVKELYPSIPIDDGLHALHHILTSSAKWESAAISFTLELASFVLRNNYLRYNNSLYLQISGTAMGTCFAPAYATLYLHVIEVEVWHIFLSTQPIYEYPILIKRYIDDILGIFHSKESLLLYVKLFNEARPSIKLDITSLGDSVDMLDVTIFKGERYNNHKHLDTKVFQKEMNKYLYTPPDSYHTKAALRSVIGSELRRYRVLCTNIEDFQEIKSLFYHRLLKRDYTPKFLNPLFQIELDRNTLLYPPAISKKLNSPTVFKIYNTPRFSHTLLKELIRIPDEQLLHPHFAEIFYGKQPIVCYKRTRNIKELIDKQKS
jgi:hypothetical protein